MVSRLIVSATFVMAAVIDADPALAQIARGSLTGITQRLALKAR